MQAKAELRVLVLSPTSKDFDLVHLVFGQHEIEAAAVAGFEEVCAALDAGAGALMVPEEALGRHRPLVRWLERQPPWSDLPVLVLARPGAESAGLAETAGLLGNVTILERPMRVAALVSAVQSALRARRRQYQIREHLAERERSEERLRANDRRKDEFLAILAHELRNPLAPISNGLHILDLAHHADPLVSRLGQMMDRQVGNLRRLVDDLLEVSRVTRGEVELRWERVELAAIVRTAIEASQPLMSTARHRFEVALPPQPVYLHADPVRLAQVLSNILNNAAKYTPAGGHVVLSVRCENGQATISVSDNGMGIPVAAQPKIFELFMQVDRNRDRAQGGLGIGLTLVKQLVELHGGSVAVSSAGEGAGSRFDVRLPLAESPSATTVPRASAEMAATALGHLHVLVADDNQDAADSLGLLLQQLGASVEVTYSGAGALQAFESGGMNAAVLDLGMNGIDGLEVARRIRARVGRDNLLLIALTGWGQKQDMLATREAGFDHHLIKPVDFALLASHLGRWRESQASAVAGSTPRRGH